MLWLSRLIFLTLSLSLNSRVYRYQVIPCLQCLHKWLYVNHVVNNAPLLKADVAANYGASDAWWNHGRYHPLLCCRGCPLTPVAKWGTIDSNVRASPHPTAGYWGADGLQGTGGKHGGTGTLSKQLCNQRLCQIFTLCFNPDLPASQDK